MNLLKVPLGILLAAVGFVCVMCAVMGAFMIAKPNREKGETRIVGLGYLLGGLVVAFLIYPFGFPMVRGAIRAMLFGGGQ